MANSVKPKSNDRMPARQQEELEQFAVRYCTQGKVIGCFMFIIFEKDGETLGIECRAVGDQKRLPSEQALMFVHDAIGRLITGDVQDERADMH